MKKQAENEQNRGSRRWSRRLPLFVQLMVLMTVITALLISFVLVRDYRRNRQSVLERHFETSVRLLNLEMQNLEQYIRELASFCLQPRYDLTFQKTISSTAPIGSAQEDDLKDEIRSYYYSRADLEGYEIYLCYQDRSYGRGGSEQHVRRLTNTMIAQEEGFALCSNGKYYNAIMPSASGEDFFDYYQSIIQIKSRRPEAVVRVTVDTSVIRNMNEEHQGSGEFLCILNPRDQLLFSGERSLLDEDAEEALRLLASVKDGGSVTVELDGDPYFAVSCRGKKYGLQMMSLLPMRAIEEEIASVLRSSLAFAVLLWLIAVACIVVILRVATRPLSQMSAQMQKVGDGNFAPVPERGGSREIAELTESFNDMVEHIDRLIRQNYLAEINEKTLRLTALEAQINPHFLYNTLQAIGTEALMNDQPQINEMLTSLASNLRYSIKGGDLVPLRDEMKYTQNYIMLQKMRLEDRLNVLVEMEEAMEDVQIPKISIQTLVENSIIHGMGAEADSIFIMIRGVRRETADGEVLEVTVADDGCGIATEQLQKMQQDFSEYLKPGTAGKIGLANLYSRLQLLYHGKAELEIRSAPGQGTDITMRIPSSQWIV